MNFSHIRFVFGIINSNCTVMKKLLLVSAVAALLFGVAACRQNDGVADATTFSQKIANCTNADSISAYVDQAKAYAEKLVKDGKVKEAQEYLTKIEPVVKEKAPAAASAISTAREILDKAVAKLEQGKDSSTDAVTQAADSTASKASEVYDAVADKTVDVKDAVVDKTKEVSGAVADKTIEVTDATVDKTKEIGKAVGDKTKDVVEKVGDKTKDVVDKVGDKAKDVKDDVKDKIEDIKKK